MNGRAAIMAQRQLKHLVEVAVIDKTAIVDRNQRAAHDVIEIGVGMGALQQREIGVELLLGDQHRAEALDRHVGQRVKLAEADAMPRPEDALVVGFERILPRRQHRTLRVINEIENEPARLLAVAERVQAPQSAQRSLEHAPAALGVDIVFQIAGQGRDDLDLLGGEKGREVFLAFDFENGQVAAVHDADPALAGGGHQPAEMRIEFGRAAGDIERRNPLPFEEGDDRVDRLARHFLDAVRSGCDVAMHAGLVAAITDIYLQGVEAAAGEGGKWNPVEQRSGIMHAASWHGWAGQGYPDMRRAGQIRVSDL